MFPYHLVVELLWVWSIEALIKMETSTWRGEKMEIRQWEVIPFIHGMFWQVQTSYESIFIGSVEVHNTYSVWLIWHSSTCFIVLYNITYIKIFDTLTCVVHYSCWNASISTKGYVKGFFFFFVSHIHSTPSV